MNISDAHERVVVDLYHSMEKRANRNLAESPEYDIQQMVSDFYQDWLRNTEYSVEREREGKFDIVVYRKKKICMLYEIKTFFKKTETINERLLSGDINKLFEKTNNLDDTAHKYLLIAGNRQKLEHAKLPEFVSAHLDNDRSWSEVGDIKLRPSRKQIRGGRTFVMTWEIKD